jgi:putative transposase
MTVACSAVGLSRATVYRQSRPKPAPRRAARPTHPRRIPNAVRAGILDIMDSARFIDQPPREVYATLLSEGEYRCSWRTMYRLLNERGPVRDRREHRERQQHAIPRLVAESPNQVWSWDISKLPSTMSGVFFNLYVVLDIFSRYVVAWMVAERENAALAKQLFGEAISRYGIEPGELIVHQDRGAPMTAHGFTELLGELGVERSYSRPRVSNDNPFSESHFHTVKYQPDYPGRFLDIRHARRWCADFFVWYNEHHHHSGLALFTPADVYFARVDAIAERRQFALAQAYAEHPERFVAGPPRVQRPPQRVLINPFDNQPLVTATQLINASDEGLVGLYPPKRRPDVMPVMDLPGARPSRAAGARPAIRYIELFNTLSQAR